MSNQLSKVQTTIYTQVMGLGCRVNRGGTLTYSGDDTVTFPSGRSRRVTVQYNRGADLYDVVVNRMDPKTLRVRQLVLDGMQVDQLPDVFAGTFDAKAVLLP